MRILQAKLFDRKAKEEYQKAAEEYREVFDQYRKAAEEYWDIAEKEPVLAEEYLKVTEQYLEKYDRIANQYGKFAEEYNPHEPEDDELTVLDYLPTLPTRFSVKIEYSDTFTEISQKLKTMAYQEIPTDNYWSLCYDGKFQHFLTNLEGDMILFDVDPIW